MPAVVERLGLEGIASFDGPSVEQPYLVTGAEFAAAAALVESQLPAFIVVGGITCIFQGYRFRELGPGAWEFFAKYGRRESVPTNAIQSQWDATGGTSHITQSINTVGQFFDPADLANGGVVHVFNEVIGVSSDGVEGTDIETPGLLFQYTVYVPTANWTPTYRARLRALTKKINNAAWTSPEGDTFEIAECRYRGFQSSRRGFDDVEVTHLFHAEKNRTGIEIGAITNITKRGQDYLWVRYVDQEGAAGAPILKRASAVFVEQVYEFGNFADLEP